MLRVHGHNLIVLGQPRRAIQEDDQDGDDDGECALSFLARGSRNAITPLETASTPVMAAQPLENAFISIHRPRNRTVCGNAGGMGSTGWGWPPAAKVLYTPTAISVSKVPIKRKVGTMKAVPVSFTPRRFTIGQDGQNQQADSQGVRLKFGQGRSHRGHAGGYAYRRGQDVIDHQGRGGQQPCFFAQVLGRDGVATAAARVGGNGLSITEIDDHQQDENGDNDGQKVLGADDPQRDQQGKRGLRTIGCTGERIEPKYGNAGPNTNLFGAFFTRRQRFAKNLVLNRHSDVDTTPVKGSFCPMWIRGCDNLGGFVRRREFLGVAAAALAAGGRGQALGNEQVVIERSNPQQPHRGKVLALITPHLDDGPIFAGGTLAKLLSEGYTGYFIRTSNDEKDSYHLTLGETVLANERDTARLVKTLGFKKAYDLAYRNHRLDEVSRTELRGRLIFLFRLLKVDTVFSYDPWGHYEENPDHYVTAQAVEAACWMSSGSLDFPEQFDAGLKPHAVSEKYYFARGPQLVNRVVDIGPWVPQKIAAIESCETMITHMVKDLNDSLAERGLRVPNLSGNGETAAQEFIQAAFVTRDRATGGKYGLASAEEFHYIGPDTSLDEYITRNAQEDLKSTSRSHLGAPRMPESMKPASRIGRQPLSIKPLPSPCIPEPGKRGSGAEGPAVFPRSCTRCQVFSRSFTQLRA